MEPWPFEFQAIENFKLDVERLKPWKEKEESLALHLSNQFVNILKNPKNLMAKALIEVSQIIQIFFSLCLPWPRVLRG